MNEHDHDHPRGPETRLTDYLFGELNAEETRALEAELASNAELREQLEGLRATFALLKAEAPAAESGLAPERRAALLSEAGTAAAPRGRVLKFPIWARAAAAVVALVGIVALWQQRPELAPGVRGGESARLDEYAHLSQLGYQEEGSSSAPSRLSHDAAESSLLPQNEAERPSAGGTYKGPSDSLPPGSAAPAREARKSGDADKLDTALRSLGYDGVVVGGGSGGVRPPATPTLSGGTATGRPSEPVEQSAGVYALQLDKPSGSLAELIELGYVAVPQLDAARNKELSKQPRELLLPTLGYADSTALYDRDFDVDREDDPAPAFGLDDGYGRRHHGREVIDHLRRHRNESPRDMFYRYYGDNASVRTADDPLSTFASDVDTASWALLRNYLVQGHLPPKAAVRTEECVNAFKHELAAPSESDFAIHLEAAPTPFAPEGHLLLRVGLKAREISRAERKPLNLVFVVDKSGSMASQNRMELVKQSLELLVDQVRDDDTIGIVTFDSKGHSVLEPTAGAERWKIREALRELSTGGSTNAAEGLFLGYAMAERAFRKEAVNRVVLASDGVANTGETDQAKILEKVRKSAENEVDLTTIGVGMGNHNDVFLERLADDGDGSCHYVDSMEEAKRVLVERFTGTMQVVAREARVQVEFSSGTVREWRQLGYENRVMKHEDFRNDSVDAGEIGAGHEMVALYELRLQDVIDGPDTAATIRLRWKPDGAKEFVEIEKTFGLADARARWELASPRFRLAGTVAQFAEFVRRSVHARGDSYEDLQERAGQLARELKSDPMVPQFRDLVDRTASLAQRFWPDDELALLIDEARRLRLAECELENLAERSEKVEELLKEVRLQNEALERRLEELLQPR